MASVIFFCVFVGLDEKCRFLEASTLGVQVRQQKVPSRIRTHVFAEIMTCQKHLHMPSRQIQHLTGIGTIGYINMKICK